MALNTVSGLRGSLLILTPTALQIALATAAGGGTQVADRFGLVMCTEAAKYIPLTFCLPSSFFISKIERKGEILCSLFAKACKFTAVDFLVYGVRSKINFPSL